MRLWQVVAFAAAWAMPAFAADIPLDHTGFTSYVAAKIQLYTPAKVQSDAPLTVAVDPADDSELRFDLRAVHESCVVAPGRCEDTLHDYVQEAAVAIARAAQQGSQPAPPKPALVPSDEDAFLRDFASHAMALSPDVSIVPDTGTTLIVTRKNGQPFRFNLKSLYQQCQHMAFACAPQVYDLAVRMAWYLPMPERSQLRAAPGFENDCSVIASVGVSITCRIRPLPGGMAAFFRRAFANLAVYCYKETPHGVVVAINADHTDLGLSLDEAVDACSANTHAMLPPLASKLSDAPGVGRIEAPWAASYALSPDAGRPSRRRPAAIS
jgi:hypothetical protein